MLQEIINKTFGTTYGLDSIDIDCVKGGHDVYSDHYKASKKCILEEDEFNRNYKIGQSVRVAYLCGAKYGTLKSRPYSAVVLVNPFTKAMVQFEDGSKDDVWIRLIHKL